MRRGWDYREVWREEHVHAFTVANMMVIDLLRDVRDSIAAAQETGAGKRAWKLDMTAHLRRRGWWGRKQADADAAEELRRQVAAAADGGSDDQQLERMRQRLREAEARLDLYVSRRLDTIWRVNVRQASQAGRWERGLRSSSHPYVIYRIGPSRKHREQHVAWDGVTLPKEDPFWSVANPTNGWNCKCSTRFVSQARYRRYQRDGIATPAQGDEPPGKKAIITTAPTLEPVQYRNTKTGKIHTGYQGIDRGFERNPGVGRGDQLGEDFREKDHLLALDTVPQGPKYVPDQLRNQVKSAGLRRRVRDDMASVSLVHGVGEGVLQPTRIRQDDSLPALGRYDAEVPEIVLNNTPDALLTTAHEMGHMIDHQVLPGTYFYTRNMGSVGPEMLAVFRAIQQTARYQELLDERAKATGSWKEDLDYLAQSHEIWARAYAQWVTWKSGSERLKDELDRGIRSADTFTRLKFWAHDEFLPVASAIDTLMEHLGWLQRLETP